MGIFVILTPGFPKDEDDSTCLPAVQAFVLSVKKIYPVDQVLILSFQYPFAAKEYLWHGVKVIALGGANRPGLRRVLTWIKAYQTLRKLHRKFTIDGLLSLWLTECSLVARWFNQFNKTPYYMWIHGQDAKSSNQYISRIRPKGKNIIAISEFTQQEFQKNHHELPFMVAHNGITPDIFPPFNSGPRPIDILAVGSLIPLKNYDLFIHLIKNLVIDFPSLNVVIAGGGIEEQRLREIIDEEVLASNIKLMGVVPHSQVLKLMSESRILLHPSLYEGNSTVMIEALYSGCKVIASCGLSEEAVNNLILCKNEKDYMHQLQTVLKTNNTAERVLFNTMDETAKKILDLYPKI